MTTKIKITEQPRYVAIDKVANFPLLSIVWRILQAEHKKINDNRKIDQKKLLHLIEAAWKLKPTQNNCKDGTCRDVSNEFYANNYEKMTSALSDMGVDILQPENEIFSSEYMELFESIAQVPKEEITEPVIQEVIEPAVMQNGAILKMGKAIIAIPLIPDANSNSEINDENNIK